MRLRYVLPLFIPALMLASGGSGESTDIIARTINFTIFAGIVYYFAAGPAKQFYIGRKEGIAQKLDSIQTKLKESTMKKEEAIQKLEEAKVNARVFIETAKRESELIAQKIAADAELEMETLQKSCEDLMEIQVRKTEQNIVHEVLDELFKEDALVIDQSNIIKVINRKVA